MAVVMMPRQFTLRFPDGRQADFPGAGRYTVDDEIAAHPMMKRLIIEDREVTANQPAISAVAAPPPVGALPTPLQMQQPPADVSGPDHNRQPPPAPRAAVEIPEDWNSQHHMTRMALAKQLTGGEQVGSAEDADRVIQTEVERRQMAADAAAATAAEQPAGAAKIEE